MSYALLVAALPAETVTALAAAPHGIGAGDVYVADQERAALATEEAWWRLLDDEPVSVGGRVLLARRFELRLSAGAGTRAIVEAWKAELRSYFHGHHRPASVSSVVYALVESVDVTDGEGAPGPGVQLVAVISFLMEA